MVNQHQNKQVFGHLLWSFLYIALDALTLTSFVLATVFPARALAFDGEINLLNQPLIFVRDHTLDGRAIIGLEAFGRNGNTGQLIVSDSFEVRETIGNSAKINVLSTAYSSTSDQTDGDPFTTASGKTVGAGVLATNFLPMHTQVRIGNQMYTVLDRMNARYDNKYIVDIWMPTRDEAIQHGVRVVEMEVISIP